MNAAQGDLFLIPAGMAHCLQSKDLRGRGQLWSVNCLFDPAWLAAAEKAAGEPPLPDPAEHGGRICGRRLSPEMIAELLRLFEVLQKSAPGLADVADGALPAFWPAALAKLVAWLRGTGVPSETDDSSKPSHCSKEQYPIHGAIRYMSDHCGDSLSLQEVSRTISVSPRHFQRLFKEYTGKSYTQMLQQIRIRRTCFLLAYTNLSVQAAAYEAGISDMKYFYRLFTAKTGMTPGVYRRQHAGQNGQSANQGGIMLA